MQPRDISTKLKALCIVLLSTLSSVSSAVVPATQDGISVVLTPTALVTPPPVKEANTSTVTTPGKLGQTSGVFPVNYNENGTLEIVANKTMSLEDGLDGEDEKDAEGEDTNNDDGDQIYSENENYLDNYDENNDEQDEENGGLDDEEDAACN